MSGELLFKRAAKLVVAAPLKEDFATVSAQIIEIEKLRIVFKITKTISKEPNTASIKVYNLSESTRKSLPGEGAKVLLSAGYEQTIEQLFLGDARLIQHVREGVDWITTFESGDGERATKFARANVSFGQGAQVGDIINTIGKATGLDTSALAKSVQGVPSQYANGYAYKGKAVKELDRILRAAGFDLSIQDGALVALKPGETTTESVVELSVDSGLIGSPEMGSQNAASKPKAKTAKKSTLKAKSLLQPAIKPGRRVKLVSKGYNGLFRALKVEHEGDTESGAWYSMLELEVL